MKEELNSYRLFFLISLTLFFFSTSSILCRLALVEESIDAYSFTFFRLFFGALVLLILLYIKQKSFQLTLSKNWLSSFMLFLYAICFSYAYINLEAGVGTLILFAVVQLTIILTAIFYKEKISVQKFVGILLAFLGLLYLLYPREDFELSTLHLLLMIVSGIAWGFYTIMGKKCNDALHHTTDNFVKSLLFVSLCYFVVAENSFVTFKGILLAFISGGITSALGYAFWYNILPKIKFTTSGVIQLIVPVIAIFLSVLFLNENLSLTLLISTAVILLGITVCIYSKN